MYELIEIAVRQFTQAAKDAKSEEQFITESATKAGLKVHFKQCPSLVAEAIELHIVNVHEAFERFLTAFCREAKALVGIAWTDYDKKDRLYVAIQNVFGGQNQGRAQLGEMQVDLCTYYRLIRNAAIHADRDPEVLVKQFGEVKKYASEALKQYETLTSAPNPPDALTRDDFQLFVRVAQDVAWGFSQKLKPTDEQLGAAVRDHAISFNKRWANRPERARSASVSYLCKTYGLSREEAAKIVDHVH